MTRQMPPQPGACTDSFAARPAGQAPLFSVIIPAYNRRDRIGRAIASCLAQTHADHEIVVVDDGSSDGTAEVVDAIADPRIRCLRQANAGASAARNTGASAAIGTHLVFLDSDDEFLPEKLAQMAEAIAADDQPDSTVWYSSLIYDRGGDSQMVKPSRPIAAQERVGDYLFADDGLLQTSTLVVPRCLFQRVRFDDSLRCLEDLDLCLRLEEAGARFRMLSDPLVIWRDDQAEGRLSYTTTASEIEDWAVRQAGRLTPRARDGYLARFLVPLIARERPLLAARLLARALRHRSLTAKRAGMLLMRGLAPATYARLRDAATRKRHV